MIQDFEFFHGTVLTKLVHSNLFKTIQAFGKSNSSYLIDDKIGLYIKYSTKRMAPWSFSFLQEHINELKDMVDLIGKAFVCLVCNDDGVCCLDWQEFCTIISIESIVFPKWIRTSRKKNEKYSVHGCDGELKHKIGISDFPSKLKNNK